MRQQELPHLAPFIWKSKPAHSDWEQKVAHYRQMWSMFGAYPAARAWMGILKQAGLL